MATLRIVLEFEQDEASITSNLLEKFWSPSESDGQHRKLGLESELALLAAVKAQPQVVRQLWLHQALSWLQGLGNTDVIDLLTLVVPGTPDLEPLVAELNEYARDYFLKAGMLNETDHELLVWRVHELRLRRIKVEDTEGVMLSSDEAPIRRNKKRRQY